MLCVVIRLSSLWCCGRCKGSKIPGLHIEHLDQWSVGVPARVLCAIRPRLHLLMIIKLYLFNPKLHFVRAWASCYQIVGETAGSFVSVTPNSDLCRGSLTTRCDYPCPHSSLWRLCTLFGADPIGGSWVLGLAPGRGKNKCFSLGGFASVFWTAFLQFGNPLANHWGIP